MNVALVIGDLDPRRGGAEQWTAQYARWLLDQGHQVHLLSRTLHGLEHPRLCWHRLPPVRRADRLAQAAADLAAGLPVDVVHDMGLGWYGQVFQPHGGSRLAAQQCGLSTVPEPLRTLKRHAARVLPRYRTLRRLCHRQFGSRRRLYIALSKMVAEHFRRFHHVPEENIRLVYNGVDLRRFDPEAFHPAGRKLRQQHGVAETDVLLLCVAHNFPLKGVPELLLALGSASGACPRLKLWVLGGRHLARWRRRAAYLGIADRVKFFGPVDDPRPYYAAADALVHPTHYDPCSLVVLEALAMGLPVISTTRNGACERMCHGRHGWVLPGPVDVHQLALSLVALAQDANLPRMRRAVLQLRPELDIGKNFQAVWNCYLELRPRQAAA